MQNRLGKFGKQVKEYEKARRPYPDEVFIFLKNNLPTRNPKILDLGCGTGISTRQLAKFGSVTGCDPDPIMLKAARKHKNVSGEKYVAGSAEKLPFKDSSFDVVAAFTSFHWFDNKRSITEIRRVLRPGGVVFVVNKIGLKSWGEGYRRAIIKSIGREVARFKEDTYNPKKSLAVGGFSKTISKEWKRSELFTLKNSLQYVQSVSIWNSVPAFQRERAVEGLEAYFVKMKKVKGKIERKLTVKAVIGVVTK